MGMLVAWRGWCVIVCGELLGGLGWIYSLWLSSVVSRVVPLVYPPLEVRQVYALVLATVESLGGYVAGQAPLDPLGGFSLGVGWVWCGG